MRMIARLQRIAAWLKSRKVELGLGVRVTVAAMGALVIALAFGLKLPLWAVLTSIIVTQMSVGRSLKATRDYLVGTLGGAIYGGAVAVLIPHSGEVTLLVVLVLAVAPLAFIAAINPSLNVATVTAIIVLLLPAMNHGNPLDSAIDRVLEVAVGAHHRPCGVVSGTALARAQPDPHQRGARPGTDGVGAQRTALGPDPEPRQRHPSRPAGRHRRRIDRTERNRRRGGARKGGRLSTGPDTGPLLRTILRLRHDLVMIGRASVVPLPADLQRRLAAQLGRVSNAISAVAHERSTAADGFSNEKTLHLNTAAGYGIDLYLIG